MPLACQWMKAVDHAAWNIEENMWGAMIYPCLIQVSNMDNPEDVREPRLGKITVFIACDTLDDDDRESELGEEVCSASSCSNWRSRASDG